MNEMYMKIWTVPPLNAGGKECNLIRLHVALAVSPFTKSGVINQAENKMG